MNINSILTYLFLIMSPYKSAIIIVGALYVLINLVLYNKNYQKGFYDLKQYRTIFANMLIASIIFFSGSLLHMSDPDILEYLGVISLFCVFLPSLLILFVMVVNVYIKRSRKKNK